MAVTPLPLALRLQPTRERNVPFPRFFFLHDDDDTCVQVSAPLHHVLLGHTHTLARAIHGRDCS